MSKIAEKLIEIEEMLEGGYAASNISEALGVPIEWVDEIKKEMMGIPSYYVFEDLECESAFEF